MNSAQNNKIQPILRILLIGFLFGCNLFGYSQEGSLASKFEPGFYYDKEGKKHEGFIKYLIVKSGDIEKIKSFKFKGNEAEEPIKFTPETSDGFGLNGSDRLYHTIYKNSKAREKNKGGKFARVYIGDESVNKRAAIYYPLKSGPTFLTKDGKQYLSAFILRSGDNTKLTTVSLVASKHKKLFKKYFKDCEAFNKALAADKKFLSVSNLQNVISLINEKCN